MSLSLQSIGVDVQTAVVSLGGSVAGAAANQAATWLIRTVGIPTQGLGGLGLVFVTRAAVSSVGFALAAYAMPETSQNVLFTLLFFTAEGDLLRTGSRLGHLLLSSITGIVSKGITLAPTPTPKPVAGGKCCDKC